MPDRDAALPLDADHALLVGSLIGLAMRAQAEGSFFQVQALVDDAGNYLAMFGITTPSGWYLIRVEKDDDHA